MDDVEEGLVARPDEPVGEVVRMGIASFPADRVDGLHLIGPHRVEPLVHQRDDLVLPDAGLEHLDDVLIDPVDHRGGLGEQHDLVGGLDLPRVEHALLAVDDSQSLPLHLEQERGLDDVDADRGVAQAGILQDSFDLAYSRLHEAGRRRNGAAHPEHAGSAVLVGQPVRVDLVVAHGRAEVPQPRVVGRAGEQRVPRHLVAQGATDPGLGRIADVVEVEQ